ncbi:MAG: hypothetical protein NC117_03135 [Pseudoflavonifractor sp.]|nr:hypothetical protein [Pseudoflavonifractor sp.]
MRESDITRFLSSRYGLLLMTALAVVAAVIAYCHGDVIPIPGAKGLGLPSANEWIQDRPLSLVVNLALNIGIACMLVLINKSFNILRTLTVLYSTLYLVFQSASPSVMGQFYDGTLLCIVILCAMSLLFPTFGQRRPDRRKIFLAFFLLGLGTLTQYAYALYIPVFLIGCVQMRCLSFKGFMAALIGLVTPVWILWGLGVISLDNVTLPQFAPIFTALDRHEAARFIATVGLTIALIIGFGAFNFIKIYSYNSRARAYNGFIGILALATMVYAMADYTNTAAYIPLLNTCAAVQGAHFFTINPGRRSYIGILTLILLYTALYLWAILL